MTEQKMVLIDFQVSIFILLNQSSLIGTPWLRIYWKRPLSSCISDLVNHKNEKRSSQLKNSARFTAH
jgi:hypothetical protein